jgi:nucleotide-binding universal stress UspA family protein
MKVVVAYDGSSHSKKALSFLVNLMAEKGWEIHLVTVAREAPRTPEGVVIHDVSHAESIQEEASKVLPPGINVVRKVLESPDVAGAIVGYCEEVKCGIIVTGSRGLTGLRRVILGSVSSALVDKSKVPVLIVK